MKLLLAQQIQVRNIISNRSSNHMVPTYSKDDDNNDHDNDEHDDDVSTTSSVSSSSSSSTMESEENIASLEEELNTVKSQCRSLERSFDTLRRKNMEREVRSLKSLRNMRRQVSN